MLARFNLVVHDPDALFNIIDKQRRDEAVIGSTMLHAGKRQSGLTLDQWLLRGPRYREMLLTNATEAGAPRPLE